MFPLIGLGLLTLATTLMDDFKVMTVPASLIFLILNGSSILFLIKDLKVPLWYGR